MIAGGSIGRCCGGGLAGCGGASGAYILRGSFHEAQRACCVAVDWLTVHQMEIISPHFTWSSGEQRQKASAVVLVVVVVATDTTNTNTKSATTTTTNNANRTINNITNNSTNTTKQAIKPPQLPPTATRTPTPQTQTPPKQHYHGRWTVQKLSLIHLVDALYQPISGHTTGYSQRYLMRRPISFMCTTYVSTTATLTTITVLLLAVLLVLVLLVVVQ